MAVYFDHRLDSAGPSSINRDIAWFKGGTALLAVASENDGSGGTVNIFNEEGEKIQHKSIVNQSQVCRLAWHPTRKILAVAWQTGEIMLWNEGELEVFEAPHLHKAEITVLHWNPSGTHLVSGDKSGSLLVWRTNIRGNLGPDPSQHQLQEPLTVIVFRPPPPQDPALDIASLARAAVSGDESALDMFNWKRGSKGAKVSTSFGNQESLSFFVGGSTGGVYYVNESIQCAQCFSLEYAVIKLLYYENKNMLVTVTENFLLTQHSVSPQGETKEILKVKMSGRSEEPSIGWAGHGILATATGEQIIRVWDLEQNDNYILNLEGHNSYNSSEVLMCVSYSPEKGILAGGTNMGNVALWKFTPSAAGHKSEGADQWVLTAPATVEGPVRQIEWCTQSSLMAVNTITNVFILSEHVMSASFRSQTAVVQNAPSSLSIEFFESGSQHDLRTDIQVKGIHTTKDSLAVWNGKRVILYEFSADRSAIKAVGTFLTEATVIAIYEQSIYAIEQNKVQVRTFQGTVKQVMTFAEPEGRPVSLDVCGQYMVVATDVGIVRIYDLSRREAKAHTAPKNMADVISAFASIVSARVNCTGSRVSILVKCGDGQDNAKVWVWDVELDTVQYFNFRTGRGEQDDYPSQTAAQGEEDRDTNDAERGKNQAARDIAGRFPISHYWDPEEAKLLVCEAKLLPEQLGREDVDTKKQPSLTKAAGEGPVETMVVSLFCTSEYGVLIQDSFSMPSQYGMLLGIEVPYLYFIKKSENQTSEETADPSNSQSVNPETGAITYHKLVARRIMRDFVGLESSDRVTRDAMMNFSFHLTTGNMDEAFKSIKLIKSESVWENMAKMCVKSRRLDVASVCLGNMGHARGAKALREAAKEPELDARVAVLAIQLGLYEDAERLLKNCKRYDLLNEFYQNRGQWDKALETAEMYDRIHLRTTYYNFAHHLEDHGNISGAILNYEKSETHRFEVPRMLVEDPEQLEQYLSKSKDKKLRQWWAQFLESTGDMDSAIQYYETAQDYFSLVRVYCYCGNMEKASKVCNDTGDKAACYYLARQYENQDQIKEAIHFFTRAQAYGSAIRLCKEHSFEDQLINLALMGRPEDMMEAARYFEQRANTMDKAVMLYHKAGNFSKALDLAFMAKQFGALQMISSDLDERADPELLQKCANFFLDNGQYDNAVSLLAMGKKFWEAVKICMDQHVEITEELAEKLTPGKQDGAGGGDDTERLKLLEAVAEVCMLQGQYHLATKKFTQAGNKVKAMKALLKSGDTEKIVFFAGVSRQKEIYVMAANYLQSVDWRKDPEIMKNIISFYTKGRALDSLASFYEACAQVEIDEYQNYDKALNALGEAYKCLSKAQGDEALKEDRLGQLKHKITLIKRFVSARRLYDDNAEEASKQCQVLLEEPDVDSAVRIGDVYGFLIEHYARKERWKAAYASLEEMCSKMPGTQLAYYINMKTIRAIHQALDIPMKNYGSNTRINGFGRGGQDEEEELGFVEEEVIDDAYSAGDNV